MENSSIEWTHHTFNPWIGCTKVSPGCAHCYAERDNKRRNWNPNGWGKGKERKRTSDANWKLPLRWNREAEAALNSWREMAAVALSDGDEAPEMPIRPRIFCASLADWLDDEVPIEWLVDLMELIVQTPNLDWLLLTKRPENWLLRIGQAARFCRENRRDMSLYCSWGHRIPPTNVWIGTTVEDQTRADERIPQLLEIPAKVRFLSCEPLLGPVELEPVWIGDYESCDGYYPRQLHWLICGGESGPDARPIHPDWARNLRDQCSHSGVAFLFKQWGEWAPQFDQDARPLSYMIRGKSETFPEQGVVGDALNAVIHVGKKAAGRLLDGVPHDEFPEP